MFLDYFSSFISHQSPIPLLYSKLLLYSHFKFLELSLLFLYFSRYYSLCLEHSHLGNSYSSMGFSLNVTRISPQVT